MRIRTQVVQAPPPPSPLVKQVKKKTEVTATEDEVEAKPGRGKKPGRRAVNTVAVNSDDVQAAKDLIKKKRGGGKNTSVLETSVASSITSTTTTNKSKRGAAKNSVSDEQVADDEADTTVNDTSLAVGGKRKRKTVQNSNQSLNETAPAKSRRTKVDVNKLVNENVNQSEDNGDDDDDEEEPNLVIEEKKRGGGRKRTLNKSKVSKEVDPAPTATTPASNKIFFQSKLRKTPTLAATGDSTVNTSKSTRGNKVAASPVQTEAFLTPKSKFKLNNNNDSKESPSPNKKFKLLSKSDILNGSSALSSDSDLDATANTTANGDDEMNISKTDAAAESPVTTSPPTAAATTAAKATKPVARKATRKARN
jgi:hypothetical protein